VSFIHYLNETNPQLVEQATDQVDKLKSSISVTVANFHANVEPIMAGVLATVFVEFYLATLIRECAGMTDAEKIQYCKADFSQPLIKLTHEFIALHIADGLMKRRATLN
jgi:hypothetical protein